MAIGKIGSGKCKKCGSNISFILQNNKTITKICPQCKSDLDFVEKVEESKVKKSPVAPAVVSRPRTRKGTTKKRGK